MDFYTYGDSFQVFILNPEGVGVTGDWAPFLIFKLLKKEIQWNKVKKTEGKRMKGFYLNLYICLFGVFLLSREFFTNIETSPLLVKGCNFWHSWPLSSEGSLACHTYCDTGHPFILVISEDPVTLAPIVERLAVKLSLPVFTTKVCHGCDSNSQPSASGTNALTHTDTAAMI